MYNGRYNEKKHMVNIEKIINNKKVFQNLYGSNTQLIDLKKKLLLKLWYKFTLLFNGKRCENLSVVLVPNRVEILGKHTDYQGGRTLLLTGPKSFISIAYRCAGSEKENIYEFVNLNEEYGKIKIIQNKDRGIKVLEKGFGWQYSKTVINRMLSNFSTFKIDPIKSVFYGDAPVGGGTSGSSAKLIMDFLNIASTNTLLNNRHFIETIIENGKLAGIIYNQKDVDNFRLALSMYLANYENGLDYGRLKGDRGVGTFGGSEDHTAILLGERDKILLSSYCPTKVIRRINWPKRYTLIVAFSGRKAEKTINTREKYNRLSLMASEAVKILNEINHTNYSMLRDFFKDLSPQEKPDKALSQLKEAGYRELGERIYQFYKEEEIINNAIECLYKNNLYDFGQYLDKSHELSKLYLKNIVEEIDFLQKSAKRLGAIGSSGFGAGFGGSCYALVKKGDEDEFIKEWENLYINNYPQYQGIAQFDVYPPCAGAYWEVIDG